MDIPVVIRTADGSNTLCLPSLNETYHSRHGAAQESLHVFIREGLEFAHSQSEADKTVHVFEMGFGTGLNAALTLEFAQHKGVSIMYECLEAFPLTAEQAAQLSHETFLEDKSRAYFAKLHETAWEETAHISPSFSLTKKQVSILDWEPSSDTFDVIYYDAFAPEKQPELWEKGPLGKCYHALKKGGILTTYCAKGQFRRNLKEIGFAVEKVPGPPGKREMTRAKKPF